MRLLATVCDVPVSTSGRPLADHERGERRWAAARPVPGEGALSIRDGHVVGRAYRDRGRRTFSRRCASSSTRSCCSTTISPDVDARSSAVP
jgi:hypothetical protein